VRTIGERKLSVKPYFINLRSRLKGAFLVQFEGLAAGWSKRSLRSSCRRSLNALSEKQALVKTYEQRSTPTRKLKLINDWLTRFAINADKSLGTEDRAVYLATCVEGFSDVECELLEAAFLACIRSHTFKTIPSIGDVRQHLNKAESKAAEEEAAQKWQRVLEYARRHFHPDLSVRRGPRISERTRRAIAAAGGLGYLSECSKQSLVFARKHFVESYLRWRELEQVERLLPPGKVRDLLTEYATMISVEHLLKSSGSSEAPTEG
jgi:hypothetical protein